MANYQNEHTDSSLEIALKHVSGTSSINKFGHNPVVNTTSTPEDVWDGGGLYVPPTAARVHNVVSTSTEDAGTLVSTGTITTPGDKYTVVDSGATFITDSVSVGDAFLNDTAFDHSIVSSIDSETQLTLIGLHDGDFSNIGETYRVVSTNGTGVAVLHIKNGLDVNFDFQGEFVITNGTTSVPTTKSYVRMNRMHADLTGSNDTNVGVITATAVTDGTVTAQINAGNGQTLMAHYTVPRNKTGYITTWNVTLGKAGGSATAQAECSLRYSKFSPLNTVGSIIQGVMNPYLAGSSSISRNYTPYKVVHEYTDVFIRIDEVTDNSSHITAEFDMIITND